MEETQSFRLNETMDTVEITLNHVEGQNIVYWEDIEQAFPGAKRVRNGSSVIKFLRGSDQQSVNHCSRPVLDVVLSTSVQPILADPLKFDPVSGGQTGWTDTPVNDRVTIALGITPPRPEAPASDITLRDSAVSKAISFQNIVAHASRKARESEIEQRFISVLAPEVQETVRASSDIYQAFAKAIKNDDGDLSHSGLRQELSGDFQELKDMVAKNSDLQEEMCAKQEEVARLQKQALERQDEMYAKQEEVSRLQKQALERQEEMYAKQEEVKQLQKQALERQEDMEQLQKQVLDNQQEMKQMHQRALDQLAVLQSRVQAVLTQTYELHEFPIPRLFVVLPQDPSRWDISSPFSNKFQLYFLCECGEHTKSINNKSEISHDISHLVSSDAIDQATAGLKHLQDIIEPGMDHVIDWMDKVSVDEGEAVDGFAEQMEKKEALEGADLRKLDAFLKDKDESKVLGNLYRTVTDEGHVKWVCIDHYRMNYQENSAKEFLRVLDAIGGSFDENVGRVEVRLRSRVLAEQFYSALGKARSVYELDIDLDWACTTSDLESLEGALKTSRVSVIRLDLRQYRTGVARKLLSTSTQLDDIYRIRDLPSVKVLHILIPKEFVKFLRLPPKTSTNVCKMSYELTSISIGSKEFGIITEVLKTNSTLTTLKFWDNSIGEDGAKALAEVLKTNSALTTLELQRSSIGDNGAKALAEALKTNSTLTTLDLWDNLIGDNGAKALAEALKTNSSLTTLYLRDNSIWLNGFLALHEASKKNPTLTTLDLLNSDNSAKRMFEALRANSALTTLD
ncbi:hypothetical protein BGZ95_005656, partial [Linnemannia exigua]